MKRIHDRIFHYFSTLIIHLIHWDVEKLILTQRAAEHTQRAAELRVINVVLCGSLRFPLRNSAVNGFGF
jgi:hypothetical protein